MEQVVFIIILSLLLIHEMDAIRAKEWKMFIVLKDMAEKTASTTFILLHLPLYFGALYAFVSGATASYVLKIIIDAFLLGHAIIHYCFRHNENNGFQSRLSKIIIYAMPVLAVLDICLLSAV